MQQKKSVAKTNRSGRKQTSARKKTSGHSHKAKKRSPRKWSGRVTATSNALNLEQNIFNAQSASKIALSLKRSAGRSKRKKTTPFQSAMSMLNFYINRAGKNLSERRKKILENAKDELRHAFGRE